MINNKTIGEYGESLSETYLNSSNYCILAKNYRTRFGEIDLIARKNDILIFFEVKARYSDSFGKPLQAISEKKKRSILMNSKLFIMEYRLFNINVRFDILEVFLNYKDTNHKINHIKNAF